MTPAPAAPGKIMVRRIVDADNSCLFNAVGYVLRRKRKVGSELRRMITDAVRGNPYVYNEVRTISLNIIFSACFSNSTTKLLGFSIYFMPLIIDRYLGLV